MCYTISNQNLLMLTGDTGKQKTPCQAALKFVVSLIWVSERVFFYNQVDIKGTEMIFGVLQEIKEADHEKLSRLMQTHFKIKQKQMSMSLEGVIIKV